MIVKTKYFGDMEVGQEDIINFPRGILGLEEYEKYILFDIEEKSRFRCLQSVDEIQIAFILINPWDFYKDYSLDIPDDDLEEIKMSDQKDLFILNVITLKDDITTATANLVAPVVINLKTKLGAQVILIKDNYTTKHLLFSKKDGE